MSYRVFSGPDMLTPVIEGEIGRQYKSVREFMRKSKIPYSSINHMMDVGINGSAYDTVTKMLRMMSITVHVEYNDDVMTVYGIPSWMKKMLVKFNALDEQGQEYFLRVVERELKLIKEGRGSIIVNPEIQEES